MNTCDPLRHPGTNTTLRPGPHEEDKTEIKGIDNENFAGKTLPRFFFSRF